MQIHAGRRDTHTSVDEIQEMKMIDKPLVSVVQVHVCECHELQHGQLGAAPAATQPSDNNHPQLFTIIQQQQQLLVAAASIAS